MKLVKGSLCHLISTEFDFDIDSDDYYEVFAHTMSYVTRGIDYSEYQNRLKPFCTKKDFSAKDFRLRLHDSEYFGLRLKLFAFRLGKVKSVTQDFAKSINREYQLHGCDAQSIYRFWREQRAFRVRIRQMVKEYNADTHLNVEVLKLALNEVLKPVSKYIKSYTFKKLRFICKSQNRDFSDMHGELTIRALNSYYKLMPCRMEPAHVVNYLKRCVHNAGVNLISANTSQKAGRLVCHDKDGKRESFSLLVVSENQMRISAESDPVSYEELAGHNPIEKIEVEHSINQLVSTIKQGGKKHKFLTILMGVDDEGFTEWLRRQRYCAVKETNSDFQMREDPTRFNILLGRYLRVNPRKVTNFLGKLKTCLDPDAETAQYAAAA